MPNIQLGDVRYNAQTGAFEARVDIQRGNSTFRYPCEVVGPITMDMATVRASLTRNAMGMSDSGTSLMSQI